MVTINEDKRKRNRIIGYIVVILSLSVDFIFLFDNTFNLPIMMINFVFFMIGYAIIILNRKEPQPIEIEYNSFSETITDKEGIFNRRFDNKPVHKVPKKKQNLTVLLLLCYGLSGFILLTAFSIVVLESVFIITITLGVLIWIPFILLIYKFIRVMYFLFPESIEFKKNMYTAFYDNMTSRTIYYDDIVDIHLDTEFVDYVRPVYKIRYHRNKGLMKLGFMCLNKPNAHILSMIIEQEIVELYEIRPLKKPNQPPKTDY